MKIYRQKKATTGALNKAERVVLRLIMEDNIKPFRDALVPRVREHLNLPINRETPPVPPEYDAAIELAHQMACEIYEQKHRRKEREEREKAIKAAKTA